MLVQDEAVGLRALSAGDLEAHVAGCDRRIIDSLGGGRRPTRRQVSTWLAAAERAWSDGGPLADLGVVERASGELAGTLGIQRGLDYLRAGQVNLSYAIYPPFRGRGYARRAVALAMRLETMRRPVEEFVVRAAPDNDASVAVAVRAGFTPAGRTTDEHGDLVWFRHPGRAPADTVRLVPLTPDLAVDYAALVAGNEDHLSLAEEDRGRTAAQYARALRSSETAATRFAVLDRERLVGRVDLDPVDPPRYALGYWVGSASTGRGIATRAVSLALEQARSLTATDVYAGVVPTNLRSVAVLERNGFVRVARLTGHDRYHRPLDGGLPRDA
ncbi:GNAT N-acetyltransferase [Phycicoccus endophyticus]|uniref:GNAT N-acetyltransferase n=1 Tax=Phycicoccus endophyticus TaxID=1690220 RepID=A0A7G9R0A0_9MICO|nr:GNAT family N-acetyltransferase [Phycicoccus endophyticus]NHI20171.1 GNAT N-acetyltransferase [Phycicoccus endophyticus]QNN49025.1 GNAT N-acetyltransferase [Phycicoccus endophyticus]GGL44723.1 hypothetical protein GCM10012283_29130 [Phycicoccus endophyticus]